MISHPLNDLRRRILATSDVGMVVNTHGKRRRALRRALTHPHSLDEHEQHTSDKHLAGTVERARVSTGTYFRFAAAGALCCLVTHTSAVPLDVVKTRMQTDPGKYNSLVHGLRTVYATEGLAGLLTGAGPTAVGYFFQGAFKFGLKEFFERNIMDSVGHEKAKEHKIAVILTSAAGAEFFADLALCPLEATRIRLVAQPTYASGLITAFPKLIEEAGFAGLYKGLPPILLKQVPYTMAKFVVHDILEDLIYGARPALKEAGDGTHLAITLVSGVAAGVAAAVVSQPADTVLSKINQEATDKPMMRAIADIMKRLGFRGLFMGTGARAVMIGSITGGQFLVYDSCKKLFGVSPEDLHKQH